VKRIGHKGAHSIEHGNTIASFQAALDLQVELIEFDIIRHPYPDGPLVLAHDPDDAIAREATTLITMEEGLDLLALEDFAEIGLDVDMKHGGYELELLEALRSRGLTGRTIITTMELGSIKLLRSAIEPGELRLGLTIPHVTRDWLNMPAYVKPALALGIVFHRFHQPQRVARLLRAGTIDAVMAFHMLVTPRLSKAVHDAGGELFAWTVDELEELRRLEALGVDGVVSNDPRLFGQLLQARK
jgi:glycerophosphoryl diester phosphodiesterase